MRAQWLSERLGQPFKWRRWSCVTSRCLHAAPVSIANAWNAMLYDNVTFNFRFAEARAE